MDMSIFVQSRAQKTAIKELKEKGIDSDEYESLIKVRQARQEQLANVDATLKEVADGRATVRRILEEELLPIWRKQTELRSGIAEKFNQNVPKTKSGESTVKTSIVPYGDLQDFRRALRPYLTDKRSISENDWNIILEEVYKSAMKKAVPPSFVLKEWIEINTKCEKNS